MSFSDNFKEIDNSIMSALGDDVIYKRGAKKTQVKATIDRQDTANEAGKYFYEIKILKTALAFIPQRGDIINRLPNVYTVDELIIDDDNYYRIIAR